MRDGNVAFDALSPSIDRDRGRKADIAKTLLSALLDRVAVGTVRRQAGLSNRYPPVRTFFWEREFSNGRSNGSAAERMGIDDESDQVP